MDQWGRKGPASARARRSGTGIGGEWLQDGPDVEKLRNGYNSVLKLWETGVRFMTHILQCTLHETDSTCSSLLNLNRQLAF